MRYFKRQVEGQTWWEFHEVDNILPHSNKSKDYADYRWISFNPDDRKYVICGNFNGSTNYTNVDYLTEEISKERFEFLWILYNDNT